MNSFPLDNIQNRNDSSNFGEQNIYTAQPTSQEPSSVNGKQKRQIVSSFFNYTTINGLQRLASATTIIGRLFWIIVVLGAFAWFSKDTYDLVKQYFDRPVGVVSKINYFRVSIKSGRHWNLHFEQRQNDCNKYIILM